MDECRRGSSRDPAAGRRPPGRDVDDLEDRARAVGVSQRDHPEPGGQPSRLTFQETGDPSPFADGELHLQIQQDNRTLYDGDFAAMSDIAQDVGMLEPGGSSTFTFTVSLPDDAPFANQGDPATASHNWVNTDPGSTGSWSG